MKKKTAILLLITLVSILTISQSNATPSKNFHTKDYDIYDDWNIARTRGWDEDGFFQVTETETEISFRPIIVFESLGNYTDLAYYLGQKFREKYPYPYQRAEEIFYYVRDNVAYTSDSDQFNVDEFAQNADELAETIKQKGRGRGDCEDMAILLATMYKGAGYRSAIVLAPDHAATLLYLPGYDKANMVLTLNDEEGWIWCEATGDSNPLGWMPEDLFNEELIAYEVKAEPILIPTLPTLNFTSLSLAVSSTEIKKGEYVDVYGEISPSLPDRSITLYYDKAGDVVTERTVTTEADGGFLDRYIPDSGGSWSVTANWEGDENYQGAFSPSVTFEVVDKGCLIATSTYGSELAPQVQFLRGFREATVYSTFAGSQFMTVFNGWYYSFSPTAAGYIDTHPAVKPVMRMILSPLLGILKLSTVAYTTANFNPELGVVLAGLTASSLIGLTYFFPLTLLPLAIAGKYRKSIPKVSKLEPVLLCWTLSISLIALAEVLISPSLMMIGTGSLVMSTVALTAAAMALKTTHKIFKSTTQR